MLQRGVVPADVWNGNGFTGSVTVANLVMEDVEERALASCPIQPPFWKRYVDDTLDSPSM